MTLNEEKEIFAKLFLKHSKDAFKAALEIHKDNINRALRIAHEFPKDPEVIDLINAFISQGLDVEFLPGKADLAKSIWDKMTDVRTSCDDYAKLAKLYAEVRGFIDKVPQQVNNNNNYSNASEEEINNKIHEYINKAKVPI